MGFSMLGGKWTPFAILLPVEAISQVIFKKMSTIHNGGVFIVLWIMSFGFYLGIIV